MVTLTKSLELPLAWLSLPLLTLSSHFLAVVFLPSFSSSRSCCPAGWENPVSGTGLWLNGV